MLYKFIALLFLVLFGCTSTVSSSELKVSGVPVDFAHWSPQKLTHSFKQLAMSQKRLSKLKKAEHHYVIPLQTYDLKFMANGDVIRTTYMTRHLLTQESVHNFGNVELWVDSFSSRTEIKQAYTLFEDGSSIAVDPSTVQVQTGNDSNIFTDSFKITVPYTGVKPGSIIFLKVKKTYFAKKAVMPWSEIFYPHTFRERGTYKVSMEWETEAVKPVWRTDFNSLKCQQASSNKAVCVSTHEGIFKDDPDISRYEDVYPQMIVSKKLSWYALANKINSIVNKQISSSKDIGEETKRIISAVRTDTEKLQAIHKFVSNQIRYVGFEHGYGGIIPRPSELTYKRRYGDCKDKATLFVDMARQAGLDAYTVLTTSDRYNTKKMLIPAAGYFDHMIACVNLKSGERCVDLTDTYNSSQQLAASLQGAVRLNIRNDNTELDNLPRKKYTWVFDLNTINTLMQSGEIKEQAALTFKDATAGWLRSKLRPLDNKERIKWAESNYHDAVAKNDDLRLKVKGVNESEQDVTLESKTIYKDSIKDYAELKDYSEDESWMKFYLAGMKSENKIHDYKLSGMKYTSRIEYRLIDEQKIIYPGARISLQSKYGLYLREYSEKDQAIIVKTEISLPSTTLPASELPQFNAFIDSIYRNQKIRFGLEYQALQDTHKTQHTQPHKNHQAIPILTHKKADLSQLL